MKRLICVLMALVFITPVIISCGKKNNAAGTVIIFHAGSLSVPLNAIKKNFEARNPGIIIELEPSGSQQAARKISDLKKPCDIIASADYRVIDKILVPGFADWNIRFAANQMVLCYTPKSKFAGEINADNWYKILQRKGVSWAHSDPDLDPCGYRALMVIQLAEHYYKTPGLYNSAIANRPKENIRPKSVELISLLETGNMDYSWEYLSVAIQHSLKYVRLPDEINLGNYIFDKEYGKAIVTVAGKKPGEKMEMKGESCTYGIALLKDSSNKKAALLFLQYMLDPAGGLKIFKDMGQPPFVPCLIADETIKKNVPEELHKFIKVE